MRMLAIECATEACSLALFDSGGLIASHHELLGRGHAEKLVPLIAGLPDKGRAEEIRVSLGPGSFTGVRIGLAAARALGLAWNARVRGYPTLALVAAGAGTPGPVSVVMDGGHGEWFVQNFGGDRLPEDAVRSLAPGDAVAAIHHAKVTGSRATELATMSADARFAQATLPDARHAATLSDNLLTDTLAPIYGRGPDARLPR